MTKDAILREQEIKRLQKLNERQNYLNYRNRLATGTPNF